MSTIKESVVYWIHTQEHEDVTRQGYVGVSTNVDKRLKEHFNKMKRGVHENIHLQRALKIYHIYVDILFIGSLEECLELEKTLRPVKQIGWNICEGGGMPPVTTGHKWNIGKKHESHSKNMKKLHIEGKMSYADKNLVGKSWWNNGYVNTMAFDAPGPDWVRGRLKQNRKSANEKILILHEGQILTLKQLADKLNLKYSSVRGRYYKGEYEKFVQ